MKSDVWRRRSPLVFLFATVFVDMIGYGTWSPLLPFLRGPYATGAVLVVPSRFLSTPRCVYRRPFPRRALGRHVETPRTPDLFARDLARFPFLARASPRRSPISSSLSSGWRRERHVATAQAYIADSTGREDRARGLGMIGGGFGLGLLAGPAIGGILSLHSLSTLALFALSSWPSQIAASATCPSPNPLRPHLRHSWAPSCVSTLSSQLAGILQMEIRSGACSRRCFPQPGPRRAS